MAQPRLQEWDTIRTMIPGYDHENMTPWKT